MNTIHHQIIKFLRKSAALKPIHEPTKLWKPFFSTVICWRMKIRQTSATNSPYLNVKSNPPQMADVCRIFILRDIKLEKNGFHSFVDL